MEAAGADACSRAENYCPLSLSLPLLAAGAKSDSANGAGIIPMARDGTNERIENNLVSAYRVHSSLPSPAPSCPPGRMILRGRRDAGAILVADINFCATFFPFFACDAFTWGGEWEGRVSRDTNPASVIQIDWPAFRLDRSKIVDASGGGRCHRAAITKSSRDNSERISLLCKCGERRRYTLIHADTDVTRSILSGRPEGKGAHAPTSKHTRDTLSFHFRVAE